MTGNWRRNKKSYMTGEQMIGTCGDIGNKEYW